jgi:hypothetical protein
VHLRELVVGPVTMKNRSCLALRDKVSRDFCKMSINKPPNKQSTRSECSARARSISCSSKISVEGHSSSPSFCCLVTSVSLAAQRRYKDRHDTDDIGEEGMLIWIRVGYDEMLRCATEAENFAFADYVMVDITDAAHMLKENDLV